MTPSKELQVGVSVNTGKYTGRVKFEFEVPMAKEQVENPTDPTTGAKKKESILYFQFPQILALRLGPQRKTKLRVSGKNRHD